MNDTKIVTLTMNPALDKSAEVERVVPEDKLRCKRPRFDAGGGGINVARAVTTLGGEATALFTAGGWSGERLTELLEKEGVPSHRIPISRDTRESLVICETETGQQFRFGMPGPELDADSCEQVLRLLSEQEPAPQFLVAGGSLPPGVPTDFYRRVAKLAGERGSKVLVDTHGDALREALAARPLLIKPNLRELGQLAGSEMESDDQIEAAARKLVDDGACEVCMVSLGAAGALWVSPEGMFRLRAPTVPIRSRVGAGDCTIAGVVLALSRGWTGKQALALGVAAGAAAVMTPGTELCRRDDVERLYETLRDEHSESKP
jgi:6-phosphofructokinase 2